MISNYFTLLHCADALHSLCSGYKIIEVYSQEKNTLCIVVYTGEQQTIKISCDGALNYLFCRTGDFRARKNSVDLFSQLLGKEILSVRMHPNDRILSIELTDVSFLEIEFFRSKANIFCCNSEGIITDAFLHKKETIGNRCEKFSVSAHGFSLPPETELTAELSKPIPVGKILKQLFPSLGGILTSEILFRSRVNETFSGSDISLTNKKIIIETLRAVLSELLNPSTVSPMVYLEENSPVCFSLLPLQQFASLEIKKFSSLFEAVQFTVGRTKSSRSFLEKKKEITSWLKKEEEKILHTLSKIDEELSGASRAEEYERFGKLIMTSLHSIQKGMKSVTLQNSFEQNEEVRISLNPALSPQKNGEFYFEKAKKAKASREEQQQRKNILQERLHKISAILEDSNAVEEGISLKNFLHLYQEQLRFLGYMTQREQEDLPPFKIFSVEGGFTVYAGKNSENNDLLTLKYAKPNDLWFHSRGSSGSHVVLKVGSGNGTPSKKAVEQAASIAAYYSKMKNAKSVPVAMTEKKYVRKPKGAKPGSVVLEREKVLFVEPKLPE